MIYKTLHRYFDLFLLFGDTNDDKTWPTEITMTDSHFT